MTVPGMTVPSAPVPSALVRWGGRAAALARDLPSAIRSDERGASLALMALSLVWIVGLASLVVDLGGGWLSRQELVSSTDAAALAAVQDLIERPWDHEAACATATGYVVANNPAASVDGCVVAPLGAHGGRITVTASDDFEALFTDLGSDGPAVQAVSSAAWGPPLSVAGLRPFGLCHDGSAALRTLIDNPPSGPTWVRVWYLKDDPDACGGAAVAGNFVTIDFESATPIGDIRNWVLDGYEGQIAFDPPVTAGCDPDATCYDRPYASGEIHNELERLRLSQRYVPWPVFDYADATQVHLIGIVRARLYAFDLTGYPENWRIELKVDPGLVNGACCGPPGTAAGSKATAICGVDPGDLEACQPSVAAEAGP